MICSNKVYLVDKIVEIPEYSFHKVLTEILVEIKMDCNSKRFLKANNLVQWIKINRWEGQKTSLSLRNKGKVI